MKIKRKSMVLSSLLRLIIAFFILYFLIGCSSKLYAALFGSRSSESYNELFNLIETLEYDESEPFYLYLDNDDVVIGFNKNSEKIDYIGQKWSSYFERPDIDDCIKDSACLCLCEGKFKPTKETSGSIVTQMGCEGNLKCNPLNILDIPAEIKSEEIGVGTSSSDSNYVFQGGFYVGRSNKANNYIPTFTETPKVIYIKKDRENFIEISTESFEISSEEQTKNNIN